MIDFSCQKCGKKFSVAESLAGKSATCKACGEKLKVPGSPEVPLMLAPVDDKEEREKLERQGAAMVGHWLTWTSVLLIPMAFVVTFSPAPDPVLTILGIGVPAALLILGAVLVGWGTRWKWKA